MNLIDRTRDYLLSAQGIVFYWKLLRQSQFFPLRELEEYQFTKLRSLLTESGRYSVYYRKLFWNAGFERAKDFKSLEDLTKVPILTKSLSRQLNNFRLHFFNTSEGQRFSKTGVLNAENVLKAVRQILRLFRLVRAQSFALARVHTSVGLGFHKNLILCLILKVSRVPLILHLHGGGILTNGLNEFPCFNVNG